MRYGNPNLPVIVMTLVLLSGIAALAQGPTYHLGKTSNEEEIRAWGYLIGPDGKGLPPGSGTAKEGAQIYAQGCAQCHGPTGAEIAVYHRPLVGGKGTLTTVNPVKSIGTYWPFATTIWDFINRAMPQNKPGSLKADEVYALTAFLPSSAGRISPRASVAFFMPWLPGASTAAACASSHT